MLEHGVVVVGDGSQFFALYLVRWRGLKCACVGTDVGRFILFFVNFF